MIGTLILLLRFAGAGLILLAVLHIPISIHLKWRQEAKLMTPANASIFLVHSFFIGVVLVMMGLPCLLDPLVFLETSRAGRWLAWSFSIFWALRLYFQWFVYPADLWRGRRMETCLHWWFTFVWLSLALLFGVCGLWQTGRLH